MKLNKLTLVFIACAMSIVSPLFADNSYEPDMPIVFEGKTESEQSIRGRVRELTRTLNNLDRGYMDRMLRVSKKLKAADEISNCLCKLVLNYYGKYPQKHNRVDHLRDRVEALFDVIERMQHDDAISDNGDDSRIMGDLFNTENLSEGHKESLLNQMITLNEYLRTMYDLLKRK